MGTMYFDLSFNEVNYEEDLENGEPEALKIHAAAEKDAFEYGVSVFTRIEGKAYKEIKALLSTPDFTITELDNEGHDKYGVLICSFSVPDLAALAEVTSRIEELHGGGDDVIYLNAPYMEAKHFTYYPRGYAGDQREGIMFDDLDDYLEENAADIWLQ